MTKKEYELWLTDPQPALQAITKDIEAGAPFDGEEYEEEYLNAVRNPTSSTSKDIALWMYYTDHQSLFPEALGGYHTQYHRYILPIYHSKVELFDGGTEEATFYLSRTRNKIVTIMLADFDLGSGREQEIKYHDPKTFSQEGAVEDFIGTVEDYAAYDGGFELTNEDIEEHEEEGRIGGTLTYTSYLDWIESREKQRILIY